MDRPGNADLAELEAKVNALLPSLYQGCYAEVRPTSMGSAALRYGADGRVAWSEIWTSFCDLALAGGPPHRGSLLPPVRIEAVQAEPTAYEAVVEELGRALWLVTGFPVQKHVAPGWIGLICADEGLACWLQGAIMAENVFVRRDKSTLLLPAGPRFGLGKEIKNVVTAVAKTCHYGAYHRDSGRERLGSLWLEPATPAEADAARADYDAVVDRTSRVIENATGLAAHGAIPTGWVAVPCGEVTKAVWLLRALAVENVLVRREEATLLLPAHPRFLSGREWQTIGDLFCRSCDLYELHLRTPAATAPRTS